MSTAEKIQHTNQTTHTHIHTPYMDFAMRTTRTHTQLYIILEFCQMFLIIFSLD